MIGVRFATVLIAVLFTVSVGAVDARSSASVNTGVWRTVTAAPPAPLAYDAAGIAIGARGNIFVADGGNHTVEKFSPAGVLLSTWGTDAPGALHFDGPRAIAVDPAGNIFVADNGVVQLSYTGKVLARWMGGSLTSAQGLAIDPARNLYVLSVHPVPFSSSFDRLTLTKLSLTGVRRETLVYSFAQPFGALGAAIAAGPDRNLTLSLKLQRHCHSCDGTYYVLRTISPTGRILSDVPENAGGSSVSIANANGDIYLTAPHQIERLSPAGAVLSTFGMPGCGLAGLGTSLQVAVSPLGPVYVADSQSVGLRPDSYPSDRHGSVLHRFAPDGTNPMLYGKCPTPNARTVFGQINALAVGTAGRLYVADGITSTVDRIGPTGAITGIFSANHPSAVATDRHGNLYVPDPQNDTIQQYTPDGHFLRQTVISLVEATAIAPNGTVYVLTAFGDVLVLPPIGRGNVPLRHWRMVGYASSGGLSPSGICLDGAGDVWLADIRHNNIQEFSSSGRFIRMWGRGGRGVNRFQNPSGLTVDGRGHLFVLDSGNNRVQEYDLRGRFLATFGREGEAPGQLRAPAGIAAGERGAIYVGDRGNDRIQELVVR